MKSEIFFFVTTIAVCVFTLIGAIALFYILKILRDVQEISHKIRTETSKFADDVDALREVATEEGLPGVYATLKKFIKGKGRKHKKVQHGKAENK